jgi:hypothetical protein
MHAMHLEAPEATTTTIATAAAATGALTRALAVVSQKYVDVDAGTPLRCCLPGSADTATGHQVMLILTTGVLQCSHAVPEQALLPVADSSL